MKVFRQVQAVPARVFNTARRLRQRPALSYSVLENFETLDGPLHLRMKFDGVSVAVSNLLAELESLQSEFKELNRSRSDTQN